MKHLFFAASLSLLWSSCSAPPSAVDDAGSTADTDGGADAGRVDAGQPVVDAGKPIQPGDAGAADVTFTIRSDVDVHPISPLIYGTNSAVEQTLNRFTLLRLGGNRLSAFNWENNASNAGSDYMYQNDNHLSSSNTPGDAVSKTFAAVKPTGGSALVTIPIGDYVAADKSPGGDVRNSGAGYLTSRFRKNRATKGSVLATTPDTSDEWVNQDEFVNWVKTNATVPVLFSLDNEPDLWGDTHAEIYSSGPTYVGLVERNLRFGRMVKTVWPEAEVTGFVSYGWNGYVTLQNASDRNGKGEFVDYYLDQIKLAQDADGHRVIDYLDLHWYPEARGGGTRIIGAQTTDAVVAARVQAARSLWDSTYRETSWVADSVGGPINLLPRLKSKIAARAPGTKLAFTEWNYGGGGHISGAVAVADVLGTFGRDGVALANYWALNGNESYAYLGFRVYRNFDGAGGVFGDTSISATSSANDVAAIYASLDAANVNRVVLIAINRTTSTKRAAMTVAHSATFTKLKVYTVTSAGAQISTGADVAASGTNAFNYAMPAMSVSVLVPQ